MLNSRKEAQPNYMSGLQKIWEPSKGKSPKKNDDDDSMNSSLAESLSTKSSSCMAEKRGALDVSLNELDISVEEITVPDQASTRGQAKQSPSAISLTLTGTIPAIGAMSATTEGIMRKIVNTKKEYIDVYQFAKMIHNSILGSNTNSMVQSII